MWPTILREIYYRHRRHCRTVSPLRHVIRRHRTVRAILSITQQLDSLFTFLTRTSCQSVVVGVFKRSFSGYLAEECIFETGVAS